MAEQAGRSHSGGGGLERAFELLAGCFALSGLAGLVDQVCFSKYLSYVLGSTAYAVSAVLAAFMGGLALGAFTGGRLAKRTPRPWMAYAAAECAVAISVAASPTLFEVITPLYVAVARSTSGSLVLLSVARSAVALLVVFTPTFAMGMTLPLVSPALAPAGAAASDRERRLGILYAANTLGGALGALLGAYWVLPWLGLSATLYASATLSGLAALTAFVVGRHRAPTVVQEEVAWSRPRSEHMPRRSIFDIVSFLSGFLVFTAEVVSTHLLAVVIGNSAYAFGLILAVFLICLAAGAALAPVAQRRFGGAALPLSVGLSALLLAITIPLWDELPLVFHGLGSYVVTFEGRELIRATVAFAVLAPGVTAMGLTFPLLLQRVAADPSVARLVGRLTAINTVGAVLGALAAGYVLLPLLGSHGTLMLIAGAFGVLSAGLGFTASGVSRRVAFGTALASLVVLVLAPGWNPMKLTAGTNVYFDEVDVDDADVVFMREDVHGGITTVTRKEGIHTLYTNGKFQGNTGWELNAQRYFAHYPSLFVDRFDRALVIGLGTGTTLGTLAAYPWKSLDVVEISPSIAIAATGFFGEVNRNVLHGDDRVTLHHDDARNWLLVKDHRFDLISIELSSVWFAGAANLYSQEFYALVKRHLRPRGVFQQWVQLHHVYPEAFARVLNTLRAEFPEVALFYGGGQGILIASTAPLRASLKRARAFTRDSKVGAVLPDGRPLELLVNDVLIANADLDRFLEQMAAHEHISKRDMISTDDNLYLEYETPRGNVLPWETRERLVADLVAYRSPDVVRRLIESPQVDRSVRAVSSGLRR